MSEKIKSIIYVCTGNTCRSPMAEALTNKLLNENGVSNVEVISRGISVLPNFPANENSISVIKKYDIDLSHHKTKLLTMEEFEKADIILTMEEGHKNLLSSIFPNSKNKIFLMYEFSFGKYKNIKDPFGMDIEQYKICLQEIYECVLKITEKIVNQ